MEMGFQTPLPLLRCDPYYTNHPPHMDRRLSSPIHLFADPHPLSPRPIYNPAATPASSTARPFSDIRAPQEHTFTQSPPSPSLSQFAIDEEIPNPLKNLIRQFYPNLTKSSDLRRAIYKISTEEQGSQRLQDLICKENRKVVMSIVDLISGSIVDIMVDIFGSCLMQKVFKVGSAFQLSRIIGALLRDPRGVFAVTTNPFG